MNSSWQQFCRFANHKKFHFITIFYVKTIYYKIFQKYFKIFLSLKRSLSLLCCSVDIS